jgi:hypothetical protein
MDRAKTRNHDMNEGLFGLRELAIVGACIGRIGSWLTSAIGCCVPV